MTAGPVRLTALAHGGGCGCKISPAVLRDILLGAPMTATYADLIVGAETSDDAAVWRLNDAQALVATTDFFMPIVDDAYDFGRIAATNALSDVYAMGATPIFALAIVGMPLASLDVATIRLILPGRGVGMRRLRFGIPVAGGHSDRQRRADLWSRRAAGLVDPAKILTNRTARAADALILTKGLGVGVLSAALRQGRLDAEGYGTLIGATTQLNAVGGELADFAGVHAVTDVTGFGLLGHALEMAVGAGLSLRIFADKTPVLAGAEALVRDGVRTGASERNWQSGAALVRLPLKFPTWRRDLLTDPQTSGGLLISVDQGRAAELVDFVRSRGFFAVAEIGRFEVGPPGIDVS